MSPTSRIKAVIIIFGAVAVTAALGWAYTEHKKRELRDATIAFVTDASGRLRAAFDTESNQAAADKPDFALKFDDDVAAVSRHLVAVRNSDDAAAIRALADAADDYLLTSREILVRLAASHRYRLQLRSSMAALQQHMRADRRVASWMPEAMRAKEQLEKDYRGYTLAADALSVLLESFPASQAKLAAHVDAALLIDDAVVKKVRERLIETSKQAAQEIEKTRQLDNYR